MNKNVRKITEGAMMCALEAVLLLINRLLGGLLTEIILLLMPLPMVVYSAKYGMKDSWVVLAAMMILGFIVTGQPTSLFYVGTENLIGLVYGSNIQKKSPGFLLGITMLIAVIADVLSMLVFASFFGYDLQSEVTEMTNLMNNVFEQSGVTTTMQMDLSTYIRNIIVFSTILTGILEGLVTHFMSRLLLKRLHYNLPAMKSVREYFPKKWYGYIALALTIGYYYSVMRPIDNEILQNVLQGFGMAGFMYLYAFGIVAVMMMIQRFVPKMKVLLIILVVLFSISMVLAYVVLGFFYITTDMHERILEGGTSHA